MITVKIRCEACDGRGFTVDGVTFGRIDCLNCSGNGYTDHTIESLIPSEPRDNYDPAKDVEVLERISNWRGTNPRSDNVVADMMDAILNRLHRHYCGGGE